ncbi:MAG: TRAP transporter fused permease subunit [bacterium]
MSEPQAIPSRFRSLQGFPRRLETFLLATIPVTGGLWALDLPIYLEITVLQQQYLGLFWGLVLASIFLLVPPRASSPRERVPWYDWIAVVASLAVGLNVMIDYPRLLYASALATPDKYLMGALSIALMVEATRRMLGKSLLVILLFFLLYGATAEYWPGLLNGSGATLQRMGIYLYLDTNALLGIPIRVGATIVLAFVLLGQLLFATGGGAFFTDVAMALMGRYRGGPAKIAIAASTLFGTISGTAVSNVVTTGIITIPMMIRNRYRKEVAAAVEAVASTGGQIMPPVMGAAAFLMAELLEISYGEVVLAALVPALLYYLLIFIQVDLEAAKYRIAGIPVDQLPLFSVVFRRGGIFLLPLAVLIYTLFWWNVQAGKAGMYAAGVVVVITLVRLALGMARREATPNWWRWVTILEDTGRSLLEIGLITGIAGTVIGVLNLSGLGFSVSLALVEVGGQSLFLLLVLSALLSILLGMGMPTASVYILLAVLIAPALEELGLFPLSAHLFIFYFGLLSMITPPVAIASYAAAALAGSEPVRTGWESVRLGAMAYVIPFIFVYSPELLLVGEAGDIVWAIASTALGALFLGVGLTGFFTRNLLLPQRALYIASAGALFVNHGFHEGGGIWINCGGALVGLSLMALERLRGGKNATASGAQTKPAE